MTKCGLIQICAGNLEDEIGFEKRFSELILFLPKNSTKYVEKFSD
jgi:hypothetical protein